MDNYWQKRALKRLIGSEKLGNELIKRLLPIYQQALNNISRQIQSIYDNFAEKGIVDIKQLKIAMNPVERKKFLKAIEKNAKALGLDLNEIYDKRYLARLTRANALKHQILLEIMAIAPKEVDVSGNSYPKILTSAYKAIQKDLGLQGATINFATLNKRVTDTILQSSWYRGNWSSRIWRNLDEFSQELPTILGGALSSGQSYSKTASILRQRFQVSKSNATRLVRTETNYFHNQAELQSYVDDGIREYEYDAIMDSRTSSICRRLEEKVFKVEDAQVGVNYPPMHPNCRSTTRVVIPKESKKPTEKQRVNRLNAGPSTKSLALDFAVVIADTLLSE